MRIGFELLFIIQLVYTLTGAAIMIIISFQILKRRIHTQPVQRPCFQTYLFTVGKLGLYLQTK